MCCTMLLCNGVQVLVCPCSSAAWKRAATPCHALPVPYQCPAPANRCRLMMYVTTNGPFVPRWPCFMFQIGPASAMSCLP
ncbi:hypothetical protein GGR52DRAFT_306847 [Hypoxylon sp. FL1284]|nr:hypothetical protein GGR52DRAFT_306847 [Hypoxylon sp. FL1284]